jgi:predicted NBD/HSP70 family sugar kinase
MMILPSRYGEVLRLIRRHGPLSRQELHQAMQLRPNTVGEVVAEMLRQGLLRESPSRSVGLGRPRQPLEIDERNARVIGVAFEAGRVSACDVNLLMRRLGPLYEHASRSADDLVAAACSFVEKIGREGVLAVGISTTGFADPEARCILRSSATAPRVCTPLSRLYAAAGERPVLLANDMHALAASWLLSQPRECHEDVLLTHMQDGALGAAFLVAGKPNRGCITGGNELGHMRWPVLTEVCVCGRTGCLERICSSAYLRHLSGDGTADLVTCLRSFDPHHRPLVQILDYVVASLANLVDFLRPHRLVLSGPLPQCPAFGNYVSQALRRSVLIPLGDRMRIEIWDQHGGTPAESAACLALAAIYQSEAPGRRSGRGGLRPRREKDTAMPQRGPT